MPEIIPYDRNTAIRYAHRWAFGRNPRYYNYDEIGGDCTNFASQCLYAGTEIMNFTPTFGWYYINSNQKAPAWSGVLFFYNFLTRQKQTPGPFGEQVDMDLLLPGDFVQLRFQKEEFSHSPIIVQIDTPVTLDHIFVAAHSYDADYRPLSSYQFQEIRFIHIIGAYTR